MSPPQPPPPPPQEEEEEKVALLGSDGRRYYNTSTGLMVYDGSQWVAVSTATTLADLDGGSFDSIAPYNGGFPDTTATQIVNGGTP